MNREEAREIDLAIETIRSVAYPPRHLIDNFPACADAQIEKIIGQVIDMVNGIQYEYDRNEKYAKCKTISGP